MGPIVHPSAGIATTPKSTSPGKDFYAGHQHSFLTFPPHEKSTRRFLWIAVIGSFAQFILFKLCYPFPDFMSDSYNYIESAALHLNANIWPVGYARFLATVHHISYSDTLLVAIQYLLIQLSLGYF